MFTLSACGENLPELMQQIIIFLFAASIGSFLNVCIYRIPIGKSIVFPPSGCPSCGNSIRGYDNIPILSYLFLGGKCRKCKAGISVRYPLIELLTAILALLLFARYGLTHDFFILSFFTAALITITFIDFDHQIIPDRISIPGIPIGLAASLFFLTTTTWIDSLIGIAAGGGFLLFIALAYSLITGKEGMGGGDVKLLAMIGAFAGWQGVIFVVFFSSLVGSVAGISYIVFYGRGSKSPIPFGPFLAISAYAYFLVGEEIINLYLVRL